MYILRLKLQIIIKSHISFVGINPNNLILDYICITNLIYIYIYI